MDAFALAVMILAAGKTAPALEPAPVVIELFTSQGCSSCPPADALLSELGADGGVLALSFHVDYWNGLGWADPWSSSDWTARQRRYAATLGEGRIYTPQLVVGGTTGFVGSSRSQAERAIAAARAQAGRVPVTLDVTEREGGWSVEVAADPGAAAGRRLRVDAFLLQSGLVTKVTRGENGGSRLRNDGVVRAAAAVGEVSPKHRGVWTGRASLAAPSKKNAARIAVILQDVATLEIVGAAVRDASYSP